MLLEQIFIVIMHRQIFFVILQQQKIRYLNKVKVYLLPTNRNIDEEVVFSKNILYILDHRFCCPHK